VGRERFPHLMPPKQYLFDTSVMELLHLMLGPPRFWLHKTRFLFVMVTLNLQQCKKFKSTMCVDKNEKKKLGSLLKYYLVEKVH
jgi:hypothetical protein